MASFTTLTEGLTETSTDMLGHPPGSCYFEQSPMSGTHKWEGNRKWVKVFNGTGSDIAAYKSVFRDFTVGDQFDVVDAATAGATITARELSFVGVTQHVIPASSYGWVVYEGPCTVTVGDNINAGVPFAFDNTGDARALATANTPGAGATLPPAYGVVFPSNLTSGNTGTAYIRSRFPGLL